MRFLPRPRSMAISTLSPRSVRSCGVRVLSTSSTAANAEMISDTGATTSLSPSASCHLVRMDSESLPTGMLMPSAGHSSMPTACTVSYSLASSPATPQAAIQLADSLTLPRSLTGAAARFVSASPIAMRPEAGASITASGVRSPMVIASPALPL
ncbi:hypothetical protein D3C87_1311320 [compost metagenome]